MQGVAQMLCIYSNGVLGTMRRNTMSVQICSDSCQGLKI